MFALVESGTITQFPKGNKGITIGENQYPSSIYTLWTEAERNAIGIYTVEIDSTNRKDEEFYINTNITYAFGSGKVTGSYGTATAKAIADADAVDDSGNKLKDAEGNQIINYGLKHYAKEQAKKTAHDLIKRFGWLVQRVTMDSSKTIPSAVITYCANIRTDCANIITAIDNASDMTAFKALYQDTYNSDGSVNVVARINRWSDDTNVQQYVR